MFLKKYLPVLILSILLTSCSTDMFPPTTNINGGKPLTKTEWGMRYLTGRGVPQNNTKGFDYLSDAADDDNDPFAQNELAYLYAAGIGTTKDNVKALHYYELAANRGLASAQYNTGLMYLNGLGTAPNKEIAVQWFQKSANKGFIPAKVALDKANQS